MEIPKGLRTGLRDGTVIPFVGAGVSMAVRRGDGERLFPSWRELLVRGAKRLGDEGKPNEAAYVHAVLGIAEPKYLDAAQHLRDHLPDWAGFLKDAVDLPHDQADDASLDLARAVWRLGSELIVTTNYDRVLEWTCPSVHDVDTWDIQAPAEQAEMLRLGRVPVPTVWHLHGRIRNAANLILTPGGYERLYPSAGERPRHEAALATLRQLFASRSMLFIGFSFADEHLGIELEGVWNLFEGHAGRHWALVHHGEVERVRRLGLPVEPVAFEDFGAPLVELVEELAPRDAEPSPADEPEETDEPGESFDIYLAAVADSLQTKRRELEEELVDRGFKVAPRIPPPHDAAAHREAAVSVLQRSQLAVHLLDGLAGTEIHDDPSTTYPREQVRLGSEHVPSQLIWVSRDLETDDASQVRFIEQLGEAHSGELHRGRSSDLVHDILEELGTPGDFTAARQAPVAKPPARVLLDTHETDEDFVQDVSRAFLDRDVLPYVNPLEDDPRQNFGLLKQRLRKVGGFVICYGHVESEWVLARLDLAVNIAIADRCPLRVFGVYLAPPPENKTTEPYKDRYPSLNFHLLDNRQGFDPRTLEPIFESLGR